MLSDVALFPTPLDGSAALMTSDALPDVVSPYSRNLYDPSAGTVAIVDSDRDADEGFTLGMYSDVDA